MRAVLPAGEPGAGTAAGSAEVLPRVGELPDPVAAAGEVLVEVEAAGLNRADLLQLRGLYPPPPGESAVPGLECAGRIAALGPGVAGWQRGARVMALLGGGGQAERVAVPVGQLMPLPEELTFEAGAAIPEAALTGWTNLVAEGRLRSGETVLVTGASGGMGSFAAQLARELGARVLAAARNRERLERLRDFGIEELVTEGDDLAAEVHRRTAGRGADLVFDLVGGRLLAGHLAALRQGGRLVLLGLLAGDRADVDLSLVLRRRLMVIGSVLRARPRSEKAELVASFASFALPLLARGALRAVVDRVVPLAEAAAAYAALAQGEPFGKILLSTAPALGAPFVNSADPAAGSASVSDPAPRRRSGWHERC
jgi:putative PIG3 family NAD(P)H quinone oxidoreductase